MKPFLLIASLLIFSSSGGAWAQTRKQVDEAGLQSWTKFNTAVATNDKDAVASMTRFPFLFQSRELSKAGFIQKFDAIFDSRVKRRFAKAALLKEGAGFEVFCGKQIFLFEKVSGAYKFAEIGVDD